MQNIPANSKYAKVIKACFVAPEGWLWVGLDFASLEDRISALTTRDPAKLAVYLQGFDGHALRAKTYYDEEMPDIDINDVASVNSIAEKTSPYYHLRQESKAPTFLLTYGGSYLGMMKNLGWPEEKARKIEAKYHELYRVSDEWVASKIQEAGKVGYVTVAFGLRVRTPLLHQVVRGARSTPHEAEAEARTAGNSCGQSWGLLNTRAGVEFNEKVRKSKFRYDIKPSVHIHDAQYHLVRDDLDTLMFYNQHLPAATKWQDHPDIWHPEVGLGGEVSIFYPSWAHEMVLPNDASPDQVLEGIQAHLTKLQEKGIL